MMIAIGELMNMKESAGFHCRNDWTAGEFYFVDLEVSERIENRK
jgi:hypothetical protein